MKLRFIFSEVGKGLSRNRAMSVSVILVTFVSLLFVGVAALAQIQVSKMKSTWYDKIEVSVYMCAPQEETTQCAGQEATDDQIDAVRQKLAGTELAPHIDQVFEETKEEAYQNYLDIYGDSPMANFTTPDMLQFAFRVKLVNPEEYEIISQEVSGMPGVSEVSDQREVVGPLFDVIDKAKFLSLGLAGVMTVAAVLLITTTIRLSALSRERETSIMRLVGASALFIQAPFMIEGAIAALAGAVLAVGALFLGVDVLVQGWLAPAFPWTQFVNAGDVWLVTPILLAAALLLALIASGVSLAKYTKV